MDLLFDPIIPGKSRNEQSESDCIVKGRLINWGLWLFHSTIDTMEACIYKLSALKSLL